MRTGIAVEVTCKLVLKHMMKLMNQFSCSAIEALHPLKRRGKNIKRFVPPLGQN
jgi:hypothetical protein